MQEWLARGAAHRRRRRTASVPRRHAREPLPRRRLVALVQRPRPPRAGDRRRRSAPSSSTIAHSTLLGLASTASIECAEELVRHRARRAHARLLLRRRRDRGRDRASRWRSSTTSCAATRRAPSSWRSAAGTTATPSARCRSAASTSSTGIFKPLLFDVHHAPQPYCYRCPLGKELARLRAWRARTRSRRCSPSAPGKIAALVLEPVMQGADGMIAQPPGYVRRMREICDRHGALLVCDEVATGFGRTGTMFAVEQEGVVPDILTWRRGSPAATCRSPRPSRPSAVFESFLGAVRVEADLLPRPHLRREPARLRRGDRVDAAPPRAEGDRGAAREDRGALGARSSRRCGMAHVGEVRQRGLMVGHRARARSRDEGGVRLRAARRPPGDPGGAQARRDPPAARERGRAHAARSR